LKLLSDSRTRQLKLIKEKTLELNDKKDRLLGVKKNKEVLIDDKEHEKTELETDKKEQQQVFTELKGKEKELMKKLKEQKESIRKLDNAIAEIIAREIEAARKRAAEETARKRKELEEKQKLEREKAIKEGRKPEELKPSANEEKKFTRTAEDERLTSDFSGNKGKLPWPVEQGFVIGGFGAHAHPTLKNVMVQNNGIDISTNKGASVRAVFKGTVKAVFSVPGMEKCVMINHGDFFTVYCHLKDVNVKVGDVVATKQKIGTVFTDEDEDRTVVQFQLWRNTDKQNPELWLAR
jgi:septal ring factor EnvC (AmiA/AmiB activator)